MKYAYTATFVPFEDGAGYYCRVPDLPGCITTGKDLPDAISQITDAAGSWLCVAEDEGLNIAPPTPQTDIIREPDSIVSIIQVDTIKHRALCPFPISSCDYPCFYSFLIPFNSLGNELIPCYDTFIKREEIYVMLSENEIKKIELATLYEIRLTISEGEKMEYSKDEILDLLDQIAIVKK